MSTYQNLLFFNKSGHQQNFSWNGNFWEGRILLPQVSEELFEIEHLFIVEKLLDASMVVNYGIPHNDLPSYYNNIWGIEGTFTMGSNVISLSAPISTDLIGATIFTYGFTGKIIDINGTSVTTDTVASSYAIVGFAISGWRTRFETPYNIVDFDEVPSIVASFIDGNKYLTSDNDLSLLIPGYLISGEGIPDGTKIISVVGNRINVNKKFTASVANQNCFIYQIEDANDVSGRLYQYSLVNDPALDAPVILNLAERYYITDYDASDTFPGGIRQTNLITSDSFGINIALNSDQEALIGRTLIIEDITTVVPTVILRLEIVGEVIGEDERLNVLLGNFGEEFYKEDAGILRDSDPEEPYPDYILINNKRKELLLQGSEIFPYLGSYKGLVNIIRFFGYQDLRIKEYWLNIQKSAFNNLTAFQENEAFLNSVKTTPHGESMLINNLLDDENSGKYKQVEIYGPKKDGTFGIKSSLEQIFPSTAYKKTPLFGLFYDINEIIPDEEDIWGYPITRDAFLFSPEEVLIKLFALKEKLKKDYLPLSAKIIDITGEGFYFSVNKTRGWIDTLKIDQINLGLDIGVSAAPQVGYIEDLRAFQTRTNTSLPPLPFVPGLEGNTDLSDFGNTTDITPYSPYYSPSDAKILADAIENYYTLSTTYNDLNLGDGDYNGPGYIRHADSRRYYLPGGFPTVLETTSFNISMDEIGTSWDNLDTNISTYSTTLAGIDPDAPGYSGYFSDIIVSQTIIVNSDFLTPITINIGAGLYAGSLPVGAKFQLKLYQDDNTYLVTELQTYDNVTGDALVYVLYYKGTGTYDLWNLTITNLFSQRVSITYYNYTQGAGGFYSWDNLRFLGYYEIEWTIEKAGDNPYFYQFRGNIKDYWRVPVILPYIGQYNVRCRVWNSFNDISIGYFNKYITVEPRNIELTSVTRFREAELYTWDQMVLSWDNYDSQWIYPVEQQYHQIDPSQRIITYAEYGNQFNDGQECNVLTTIPEVRANLNFNLGVVSHEISSISSVYGSGYGPATVTTTTPHGLNPGDVAFIVDLSITSISGEYTVLSVTPTTFVIPLVIVTPITTVGNYMTGPGTVTITINGRNYTTVPYQGSIGSMAGELYASMNGLSRDPHYTIKNYTSTTVIGLSSDIFLYNIIMESPINTGAGYNGQIIDITSTGSIILNQGDLILSTSIAPALSGGANQTQEYIYYSPGDPLPMPAMKNWGSKEITWDSMNDISWDQLYAQTLPMYDYHGDWNGGFDLYNISYGDLIQVGKKNPGLVIGAGSSPGSSLVLYDVARQLNESTDPGLSKFNYDVRGYSRVYGRYDSLAPNPIESITAPHITYSQSSVYPGADPADYTGMTNGSYRELTQTATNDLLTLEWIQMDLNQPMYVSSVIIGCDYDVILLGGAGPSFTESRDVQYSIDGITWNLLFNTGLFTEPIQEYPANVVARYIRITAASDFVIVTEFYAMVPMRTDIGPMDEITYSYTDPPFGNITSIAKGLHGEIYMVDASNDLYTYVSPTNITSILMDYNANSVQTDRRGRVWAYGSFSTIPLQILDPANPNKKIVLISQAASPIDGYENIIIPIDFTYCIIEALAIDDRRGDFAFVLLYTDGFSPFTKLLYYDGGTQSFDILDTPDGLASINIRQMVFDYKYNDKKLWIATDNGISIYDRIKFFNYQQDNSGLFSNDVYSICIDEKDNKWIGTSQGIAYFDGTIWATWNSTNSPALPVSGIYSNIVTTGHGNIFFIIDEGGGVIKLTYFNGDNFILYTNEPGSNVTFNVYSTGFYENTWLLVNDVKTIDGLYTQYPGNIFYLDGGESLKQIDYVIPHIHASSKYPGNDGWDFIYYTSSRSLPSTNVFPTGVGYGLVDFNFIIGPINGNYILNDAFRPDLPLVDSYSWKKPHWVGFDFDGITRSHPDLNPDHLFLDAPLRDILDGSALKEEYWRNSPIERSASKKSRDEFSDFEWLIRLGDVVDDKGMRVTVGQDGYIYVTGYFQGTIFFGAPNNVNSGITTTLSSPDCRSIFIAKYNSSGIIQWVRMYGEPSTISPFDYDFTPTSIKLDSLGNSYVVGYKEKNRNNIITMEKPSNLLLRWDWNGTFISATELFTPSSSTAFDENFDVVVDDVNNLYIAGEFSGTLTSGTFSITTATPTTVEIYVAKVEYNGYITYLNKLNTGEPEYSPSLALGNYNDLYISYYNKAGVEQSVSVASYNALNFNQRWLKKIENTDYAITSLDPVLRLSKNGELVLGISFNGTLSLEGESISCPLELEFGVFKFLTTGNLIYAKNIGSGLGDYLHDMAIDQQGRIYMIGSYSGVFSPSVYSGSTHTSVGAMDILLIKLESDASIIDITSLGSLAQDEGLSISLDSEENIYLTGYISGAVDTGRFVTSPSAGGTDIFIGKIPHQLYIPGKSFDGPVSWLGTQSWGWSTKKIYQSEFEVPMGSTVFINPLDSNIPGKQSHKWQLIEKSTGSVVIDVKDVPYFIWTFRIPGYYTMVVEITDTNGNVYTSTKDSYIRVVDHKAIFQGEAVPHLINSNDFKEQAIYPY